MNVRALAGAVSLLALTVGCGGDKDETGGTRDAAIFDGDGSAGDAGPNDDGGAGGGGGGTRLRLSYIREVTPEVGAGRVDLYLYDFTENQQFNLTEGAAADVVDCTKSCKLTGDERWVGWLESDAGGGFALWVAPVDVNRKLVEVDKKRKVNDVVNTFDFSGRYVVYSRGQAAGIGGTIDVFAEPIAGPKADGCDPEPVANQGEEDCQQVVGQIDANGGFRVTPFGSLIILLRTTLSSMTVDFFNIESGANQSLYTFGSQEGTGSQFDGRLPVSLSPDATYLAVATRNDLIWRMHTLEARPNPPEPKTLDLYELKSNPMGDCQRPLPHATDGEVFFNQVLFNPRFSDDGEFMYFLAKGDCSKRDAQAPVNRDDYDIFRLGRDLRNPVNLTNNPRASHWSNHDIGDFDLTADATRLAFTAQRPNDSSSRSIWLLNINGDQIDFDCSRNEGSAPQGIDGKAHCEFIFDEIADAAVVHRDVSFHVVQTN